MDGFLLFLLSIILLIVVIFVRSKSSSVTVRIVWLVGLVVAWGTLWLLPRIPGDDLGFEAMGVILMLLIASVAWSLLMLKCFKRKAV
jgi:hypothetical protein